jgi:hypothetical protein
MQIQEVYEKYSAPPSLQLHMLRVTAVAKIVSDSFTEPVNQHNLLAVCLLHDIANIIKFNFSILPELFEPEGVEHWRNIQQQFITKYGTDERQATKEIMQELNVSQEIISIFENLGYKRSTFIHRPGNLEIKIGEYADMRVDPHGIVSIHQRLADGRKRYGGPNSKYTQEEFDKFEYFVTELEVELFTHCTLTPESITNEVVEPLIEKLRSFEI